MTRIVFHVSPGLENCITKFYDFPRPVGTALTTTWCINILSAEFWFSTFDEIFQILLVTRHVYVSLRRTRLHFAEKCPALAAGRRSVQLPGDAGDVWIIDQDAVRTQHLRLAFGAESTYVTINLAIAKELCVCVCVHVIYDFFAFEN